MSMDVFQDTSDLGDDWSYMGTLQALEDIQPLTFVNPGFVADDEQFDSGAFDDNGAAAVYATARPPSTRQTEPVMSTHDDSDEEAPPPPVPPRDDVLDNPTPVIPPPVIPPPDYINQVDDTELVKNSVPQPKDHYTKLEDIPDPIMKLWAHLLNLIMTTDKLLLYLILQPMQKQLHPYEDHQESPPSESECDNGPANPEPVRDNQAPDPLNDKIESTPNTDQPTPKQDTSVVQPVISTVDMNPSEMDVNSDDDSSSDDEKNKKNKKSVSFAVVDDPIDEAKDGFTWF
uniref:WASH complex subunit CCDC53 homolog n=1 Tax=Saccoglossus kowalevskii TaxID=10224 RepID=A0ABM0M050_SACKO|nr:PREDICTED: WASH complex subunit CCDC53 homolog [Saccoglossus kowalevskii]